MVLRAVIIVVVSFATSTLGQGFNPVAFKLDSAPSLSGALSPNYALYNVEKLHARKVAGPTSFAFLNGSVYSITADRKIVDLATCPPKVIVNLSTPGCRSYATCGHLSSIRVGLNGELLVLDAYRGLYQVNPLNGAVKQLYSALNPVGGRVPKYLNDMVQTADGIIMMIDSSNNFDVMNDIYIIMEGKASGRVMALNPATGAMTEVLRDVLVYPNGMELSADGTALFIAEAGRARILRMSLLAANYKQLSVFANNLPGVPGNIRRSSRGTYWVGLSLIRHGGMLNSMDMFANNPAARRRTVQSVPQNTIRSYYPKYGMVVELAPNGRIIGSLHDPSGQVYTAVSEASEHEGLLYIGSPHTPFAGRIVLPQGDGRIVTIDSVIQVMRSRCQIPEDKLEQAKAVLNRYIAQQTGVAATGSQPQTTTGSQSTGAQFRGTRPQSTAGQPQATSGSQSTGTQPRATSGSQSTAGQPQATSGSQFSGTQPRATSGSQSTAGQPQATSGSQSTGKQSQATSGSQSTAGQPQATSGSQSTGTQPQATSGSQSTAGQPQATSGSQFSGTQPRATSGSQSTAGQPQATSGSQSTGTQPQATSGSQSTAGQSQATSGSQSTGTQTQATSGSQSTAGQPQATSGSQSTAGQPQATSGSQSTGTQPQATSGSQSTAGQPQATSGSQSTGTQPQSTSGSQSTGTQPQSTSGTQSTGTQPQSTSGTQSTGTQPQSTTGSQSTGTGINSLQSTSTGGVQSNATGTAMNGQLGAAANPFSII